ncbi:MAG: SHOCT domain-containing protein, partial [Candidatus Poseidoniia archaeon]|nr:SHOCT domain-containing protein [Candidatus Poseidoniia archaeon]
LEKEKLEKEKKEKLEKVKQREKAKDYEAAIQIWESLGEIKEAARVRELQAEMGSVQVAQSIVQGDQITEIKDSVVSKSNIGTSPDDKFTRLEKLTEMKEKGLIDDAEFKQMKKEILGK